MKASEDGEEGNAVDDSDDRRQCSGDSSSKSPSTGGAIPKVQKIISSQNGQCLKLNNLSSTVSTNCEPTTSGYSSGSSGANGNQQCNGRLKEIELRNIIDHEMPDKIAPQKPPPQRSAPCRRGRPLPLHCDSDSESNSSDNENDECCIYTYKGDQNCLPSSAAGPPPTNNRDGASSPEMDFLEMDFDPDPSGEQDSVGEQSDEECNNDLLDMPVSPQPENVAGPPSPAHSSSSNAAEPQGINLPSTPPPSVSNQIPLPKEENNNLGASCSSADSNCASTSAGPSYSALPSTSKLRPTTTGWPARDARGHHSSGGELCSPGDSSEADGDTWADTLSKWYAGNLRIQNEALLDSCKFNLHSALYHCIMAKRLVLDKADFSDEENTEDSSSGALEKTMIWTELEASGKQVSQIAVSACGATAVINVLLALNIPFSLERAKECVNTRLRAEPAALPDYLFSRSVAGSAHRDLIRGLELASNGSIYSRFFHMYPERSVSLSRWLAYWIKKGAVPIATLNLQNGVPPGNLIPDSWHHQMIFGVSRRGIYLTNPLECVSEAALWPQLCSPSVLLVRRTDIVSRWTPTTDLSKLATSSDIRWKKMNVLGQVVNVLRESNTNAPHPQSAGRALTSHVSLPASYCSGVLLAVLKDTPVATELKSAPELPLLS